MSFTKILGNANHSDRNQISSCLGLGEGQEGLQRGQSDGYLHYLGGGDGFTGKCIC